MFRRLRENGPVVLVPLAWGFVTAAHRDLVTTNTLLMAHVVMTVLLLAFAALSYTDMREGALYAWWLVIAAGIPFTLAGLGGLTVVSVAQPLLTTAIVGWMLLPAVGLLYTGWPVRHWRLNGAARRPPPRRGGSDRRDRGRRRRLLTYRATVLALDRRWPLDRFPATRNVTSAYAPRRRTLGW